MRDTLGSKHISRLMSPMAHAEKTAVLKQKISNPLNLKPNKHFINKHLFWVREE